MVEIKHFLFGVPNSISKLHAKKLLIYGCLTVLVGVASLHNAGIATALEAVKSHYITQYVNTHWITSIFIISGGTTILVDRLHINFFLFTAICTNFVAVFTAAGAIIFDCVNLHTVNKIDSNSERFWSKETKGKEIKAMIAYSIIDIICCIAAFILSLLSLIEIQSISKRYFSNLHDCKSKLLLFIGILLCYIGIGKQILWIVELCWLVDLGETARFMFLNYTMDEPVWNCIYILTGVLNCWTAWKGARTLAYCTLPITALSAYPAIQYLWIDYRWILSIQLTEVMIEIPKPDGILTANLSLAAIHLVLITAAIIQTCRFLSTQGLPWSLQTLTLSPEVRKTILWTGVLLIFAGSAFFITDVVNIQAATFYRLFYPTEQKLPFFLIPAGVLCIVIVCNQNVAPYFIPCILILLLLICHSTMFQILTYIYLTNKLYFGAHLCDLFFYSRLKCTAKVERIGAIAHFMEASLAVTVTALSLYGSMLFGRMLSFYALPEADQMTTDEQRVKKRHTILIRINLTVQLILGTSAFLVCVFAEEPLNHDHPLFPIHGTIQRITFSIVLMLFPTVQLIFSSNLHKYPMKNIAQLGMCCIRITDVLMQVDYRNVANIGIGWTVLTAVELISLFLHFANFIHCGILLDLGINRLPNLEFAEENSQAPSTGEATTITTESNENSDDHYAR